MSGAGIGTIIINVTLNKVIQMYGWRGGLRMLGGMVAAMFACGSVYLPPPSDFYAIREWTHYEKVRSGRSAVLTVFMKLALCPSRILRINHVDVRLIEKYNKETYTLFYFNL
jgi:hypothetical protein